eukprot:868916_1
MSRAKRDNAMEFEMRDVEAQRDKVLVEIKRGNVDKPNREQLKKHENKLKILHNELRNAKLKLKANQNLIRAAAKDEVKIKRLRSQIDSFKKQKVAMSRRIKEEESKFRLFNKEMMGKIRTFEKKTRKMDYGVFNGNYGSYGPRIQQVDRQSALRVRHRKQGPNLRKLSR